MTDRGDAGDLDANLDADLDADRQESMSPRPRPGDREGLPRVRLATWVNVVLVLILFVSCAGADQGSSTIVGSNSDADLEQVCQVLVAIAAKDGVDLDRAVFHGTSDGPCAQAWQVQRARQGQSP